MSASGEPKSLSVLSGDVQSNWQRFLDVFDPLRPELYRYCRYLTRSPWDAEDLAQDALMRGFVTLGTMFHEVSNPRAWLFRVASNLWIDRVRRSKFEVAVEVPEPDAPAQDPRAPREAAGSLFARLSPQERAAVVLSDVFGFSLGDVAQTLSTSVGAVKTALHRGRRKLAEPDAPPTQAHGQERPHHQAQAHEQEWERERAHELEQARERAPTPGVLDAFCEAFNARDLERLTALLLDSASVELVGVVTEYGPDEAKDAYRGSFAGMLSPITHDERGGVPPEFLKGYQGRVPRCEVRAYRGEPILLFWYDHDHGPAVRCVMTIESHGNRIARLRNYFFNAHVIAEVCQELGVAYRVNGYRYWPEHGAAS